MKLNFHKIGKAIGASILGIAMMTYVGTNLNEILKLKSVQAEETAAKSCFVRTTSNCPKVGPVDGGQRVTCDTSGTSVPNSTCTPVVCVTGAGSAVSCPAPPEPETTAGTASTGTGGTGA